MFLIIWTRRDRRYMGSIKKAISKVYGPWHLSRQARSSEGRGWKTGRKIWKENSQRPPCSSVQTPNIGVVSEAEPTPAAEEKWWWWGVGVFFPIRSLTCSLPQPHALLKTRKEKSGYFSFPIKITQLKKSDAWKKFYYSREMAHVIKDVLLIAGHPSEANEWETTRPPNVATEIASDLARPLYTPLPSFAIGAAWVASLPLKRIFFKVLK